LVNRTVLGTLTLSPYYGRPDVVAQLTALEKKKSQLITTQQVIVQEAPELGGAICTSRGMPQDIRISPDGRVFYVADMLADGVYLVDGDSFVQVGFIPTGRGAHGLYPSRDGSKLYVANRGSHRVEGAKHGMGSVSVIDFAARRVTATWRIPGGGSPDMGNVSPDGRYLWLSGRFDNVVYRFDTRSGAVASIAVGKEPHGLAVWPQPGRYSLGHTGNMR
jgi:DNA-binding beta-propeller fold protein YncE